MAGGASPKKRLSDLRKTRKIVKFEGIDEDDDGNPEPYEIEVWVCKLQTDDMEAARRTADAAKARAMIDRSNRESELWQSAYGATLEMGDDAAGLAEYLSFYHIAEKSIVVHAELAGDESTEWGKDGYLNNLLEAWQGTEAGTLGLQLAYAAREDDPDTIDPELAALVPEAERVYAELQRFEDALEQRLEVERQRFIREHEHEPIDDLRVKVVELVLNQQADSVWLRAFERARIFYATRELSDWRTRYFKDIREIADTDPEFIEKIRATYQAMTTEGLEGKGLPGPRSSSPVSGSSGEEETSEASGPTAANA